MWSLISAGHNAPKTTRNHVSWVSILPAGIDYVMAGPRNIRHSHRRRSASSAYWWRSGPAVRRMSSQLVNYNSTSSGQFRQTMKQTTNTKTAPLVAVTCYQLANAKCMNYDRDGQAKLVLVGWFVGLFVWLFVFVRFLVSWTWFVCAHKLSLIVGELIIGASLLRLWDTSSWGIIISFAHSRWTARWWNDSSMATDRLAHHWPVISHYKQSHSLV